VEVYTPIPESALPHAPHWLRVIAATVAIVLLAYGGLRLGAFMYDGPRTLEYHIFGVTETQFGKAVVMCGGESATPCAEGTTLRLIHCTNAAAAYFSDDAAKTDSEVRALIGKRPPKGDRWEPYCGWSSYWPSPPTNQAALEPL